jgi:hypothetical protein
MSSGVNWITLFVYITLIFGVCNRVCSLSKLHSLHLNSQALSQVLQHKMDSQTTVLSGQNITAP